MTAAKPRSSYRTEAERDSDLDRVIATYADTRRPAQGTIAGGHALRRAQHFAGLVRDEGPDGIGAYLDTLELEQLYALTTVLAAMVPVDVPVGELLAWLDGLEEPAA